MSDQRSHFYEFGRFRINTAERLLLRDQEVVSVTPKVFDILLTLVERTGHIVEKDDLMQQVWPDTFVEEGSLTQNVSLLRKALGENASNGPQYIETVARRGYRFIAEVREIRDSATVAESDGSNIGDDTEVEEAGYRNLILSSREEAATVILSESANTEQKSEHSNYFLNGLNLHKRASLLILAVVIIAVTVAAYLTLRGNAVDGSANVIESIAVLPFANNTSVLTPSISTTKSPKAS